MAASSRALQYQFDGPNPLSKDWSHRRRSRSVPTPTQASSSLAANKRKFPEDNCDRTSKKRRSKALQSPENIKGQAGKAKLLSAEPSCGVDLKNGIIDHKSHTSYQNSIYKGFKPKERQREAAPLEDTPGSGGSSTKRLKLTQKNLKLLERSIDQNDVNPIEKNMSSSGPTDSRSIPLSKRSRPTELSGQSTTSSQSGRAYAATDIRFEKTLSALNVKFARRDVQPDANDVKAILDVMEEGRDSPEPDSDEFYETLSLVQKENEAAVMIRLTTLLVPLRDRPSNNHKTKDLLYRFDTRWRSLGSVRPGLLPVPKPGLCITIRDSAFSPEEQSQMTSPYVDEAGFYPLFICEVKTALQGDHIADRQNANNAICALIADFQIQQQLGRETERKIRLITTAHNTRGQWYTGWFHVFGADGKPEWCSKMIKEIRFSIEEENGFRAARRANLNLSERVQNTILPQLHADLAEVSKLPSPSIDDAALLPELARGLGLHTPAATPSDETHDSGPDPRPTSKRAKTIT